MTVHGRFAVVLGLYMAAGLVAGLLAFARSGGWSVGISLPVWAGAFLIGMWLVRVARNGWSVVGGTLAGFAFVVTAPSCVHAATLELRGLTVDSTVMTVSHAVGRSGIDHEYRLADPEGHQIAGHLSEAGDLLSGDRRVGDHVLVVADPEGLVDPETPSQLASAHVVWIVSGMSLVVTVFMALRIARSGPVRERARHRRRS